MPLAVKNMSQIQESGGQGQNPFKKSKMVLKGAQNMPRTSAQATLQNTTHFDFLSSVSEEPYHVVDTAEPRIEVNVVSS